MRTIYTIVPLNFVFIKYNDIFVKNIRMYLGNIVSKNPVDYNDNFNYCTYGDFYDTSIPTLYIGYHEASEILGSLDSTERVLDPLRYWTFSKNENNKYMINDMFNFKIACHYHFISDVHYVFLNPFDDRKKLYKCISTIEKSDCRKMVEYPNGMVYICTENIIFGLDLNFMSFVGFNIDTLKESLKKRANRYELSENLPENILLFNEIIEDVKYACYLI